MSSPRRYRAAVFALIFAAPVCSCGGLVQSMAPTYRSTADNAHIHAGVTEQLAHNFAFLHAHQWEATLAKVDRDAVPFLAALKEHGASFELRITPYASGSGASEIETYEVLGVFTRAGAVSAPAKGAATAPKPASAKGAPPALADEIVLPGRQGTDPAVYAAAAAQAEKMSGVPVALIQRGHFALYGMVQMMTALNASHVSLGQRAFALLVMREKVRQGEKADTLDPNRPAAQTDADVDDALRVIVLHDRFLSTMRAEVLLLTTLSARYREPGAIEDVRSTAAEQRERSARWMKDNPQLTMEQLSEKFRAYVGSGNPLDQIEEQFGFVLAVAQVAKGVVTGSPSATLDGIARLAPKDSSVRTAIEGLAAATRGDVLGAADAAAKLAGSSASASEVKAGFEKAKRLGAR